MDMSGAGEVHQLAFLTVTASERPMGHDMHAGIFARPDDEGDRACNIGILGGEWMRNLARRVPDRVRVPPSRATVACAELKPVTGPEEAREGATREGHEGAELQLLCDATSRLARPRRRP